MGILSEIPLDVIRLKQLALAQVAPRVQYAMPDLTLLSNISDDTIWDPPFPDAAEIALDGFITHIQLVLRNHPNSSSTYTAHTNITTAATTATTGSMSTSILPPRLFEKEWSVKYTHVIVQVPQGNTSYTYINPLVV